MIHIPLPFPDTSLLLSPRWTGMSSSGQVAVILLCLIPPALVLWLYRYEMRLVPRSRALTLLGLRMLVLLFVLGLGMLQPIVQRMTKEELRGRVLVAVDRSDSMDVTDPQRPAVDKLRLARALQMSQEIAPDSQVDFWIKQYEKKGETAAIDYVPVEEFPSDPAKRREVGEQRRALHDKICQRIDQLTRSQTAQRLLTVGVKLLPGIADKHQLELTGFALDQWDMKPDQVEQLFQSRPAPTGGTDLCLPLDRALERPGVDEGKLIGIVVLTDGQHNGRESPVTRTDRLRLQGMPIYPIALGSRVAPPGIAVAQLKAPPAAFKEVDIGVEAAVVVSGLPAQEIVVELQRPNQPPQIERIKHDGKDRAYPVHFQVKLDQVGSQGLTVVARADPAKLPRTTKIRTDLSTRSTTVNVADDKAKVLLIDGEARYEYHYLATALGRDRKVELSKVVFLQPRLGKLSEEELKKMGNPATTLPTDPDALSSYDCIILGDVNPELLTLPDRVRLEKYVADRGGTLVLLAGKRSMPLAYSGGDATAEADPMWKLLPVRHPRPFNTNRGFSVLLTDEGERASYLRMKDGALEESRKKWSELPRHYWGMIGEAKPGAVVLASLADGDEAPPPRDKPGAEDPARKRALFARQNYGFGRVLYLGIDSTWRWRKYVGDTDHHRFWSQVIHWSASDKPLVTGNETVRFGTRQPVYDQGDEVDVVVRLADDVPPLPPTSKTMARILRSVDGKETEEVAALVELKARPAQPRVLEGRVRDLPSGPYRVELAIPELTDKLTGPLGPDGQPTKLRASFSVTPRDSLEMLELAVNWPLLRELAGKSGGEVFTPETAGGLVELLKQKVVTREVPIERKLWQEWATLVLFLLVLSAEWIGRKMAGLP